MAAKDDLGRAGENRAVAHLIARGFGVLERNWRSSDGEIDIVARTGDSLVFVEVKTRRSDGFGDPLEAVDARKRARLWRLAHAWELEHRDQARGCGRRLDVIGITGADPSRGRLEHIEDVSWS
ncbi:YraN family protein [Microbacterium terrisoli]|uniref:YraN family protein n=1 Tax=Microbacterium terrisoli TaxID=3242192 RepID=UPI002805FE8B|nr:YraN family protein [Microbacterium protaetiae]